MGMPTIDGKAAHVLDSVIVTLSDLREKTKPEKVQVRADLEECIATCERVQAQFAEFVALAARIDAAGDKIAAQKSALADVLGIEQSTPMDGLLHAAAEVIRYATEVQTA